MCVYVFFFVCVYVYVYVYKCIHSYVHRLCSSLNLGGGCERAQRRTPWPFAREHACAPRSRHPPSPLKPGEKDTHRESGILEVFLGSFKL